MTTKAPSADTLMDNLLAAKADLGNAPVEEWLARVGAVLERPEFRRGLAELEAISGVLPEGHQVTQVLRQMDQASRILPQVIAANLKTA